jgi:hypothetical protein
MRLFFVDANTNTNTNKQGDHSDMTRNRHEDMMMNPPDGSTRFTYDKVPSTCTNSPNAIKGTKQLKLVNGCTKWNNTSFIESPKKTFC